MAGATKAPKSAQKAAPDRSFDKQNFLASRLSTLLNLYQPTQGRKVNWAAQLLIQTAAIAPSACIDSSIFALRQVCSSIVCVPKSEISCKPADTARNLICSPGLRLCSRVKRPFGGHFPDSTKRPSEVLSLLDERVYTTRRYNCFFVPNRGAQNLTQLLLRP